VIEYIAPSVAASYPSFFPSFDQIHEAVTDSENPQFSINADETSKMSVERIQEQSAVSDLVTTVESSPVVDSVPMLHAVQYIMPESRVPAPQIQEQVLVPEIPRARVIKRIRRKRAHQRTVEQNVCAPVPVQEQSFVPEKPGAQGEEQMPKSLDCRALADLKASELEEEEAYWNEYVDQMGPEQMHQDWLLDQLAEQMHQERKSSKKKKRKIWIVLFRLWNGFRNTLWCPLIRRRNSTTSRFNVGSVFPMVLQSCDTDWNQATTGRTFRGVLHSDFFLFCIRN